MWHHLLIWAIKDAVLSKDNTIQQATLTYIDNVFFDENKVSAARVRYIRSTLGR